MILLYHLVLMSIFTRQYSLGDNLGINKKIMRNEEKSTLRKIKLWK